MLEALYSSVLFTFTDNFKDKVFTWRADADAGEKHYLDGGEKEKLMSQIDLLRDSDRQELLGL